MTRALAQSKVASSIKLLYLCTSQTFLSTTNVYEEDTLLSCKDDFMLPIFRLSHRNDIATLLL